MGKLILNEASSFRFIIRELAKGVGSVSFPFVSHPSFACSFSLSDPLSGSSGQRLFALAEMDIRFPTASTALIQLRDGDYNLSQLSTKVDEAVKDQGARDLLAEPVLESGDQSSSSRGKCQNGSSARFVVLQPRPPIDVFLTRPGRVASTQDALSTPNLADIPLSPAASLHLDHVHLHSHTLEIALTPPKPTQRRMNTSGRYDETPNPDRERFDALLNDMRRTFAPSVPFAILPYSNQALHVPVDTRGRANTKAQGFQVLLPSKLKRQNVTPFLKHVVYPYDHHSREWFTGSAAWDTRNWIHAALALDAEQPGTRPTNFRPKNQKVFLGSKLDACWMLDDTVDDQAEIHLILTIDLYLDPTTLFDPAPDVGQDLLGLILHSLIPSPTSQPATSDSDRRASSLRHFFASVGPAPPVPNSRSLQPALMTSKLLPFQNRTVALLIQRERLRASDTNSDVHRDPRGFWTVLELGSLGRVAYSRVNGGLLRLPEVLDSGVSRKGKEVEVPLPGSLMKADTKLVPTLIDLSSVRGTMLCEEMGEYTTSSMFVVRGRS